jgi:flagellar biosynthesis/type III secretory pathway ATPase
VDLAIVKQPAFEAFLAQGVDERTPAPEAFARLAALLA